MSGSHVTVGVGFGLEKTRVLCTAGVAAGCAQSAAGQLPGQSGPSRMRARLHIRRYLPR